MLTTSYSDFLSNQKLGGSEFVADNNINESKEVDGIYFLAGNNIKLEGQSEYTFVAGNILNISSTTQKDLFVAGNEINIDGNVGRDSYIAASILNLSGSFGRDIKIYAEEVYLKNIVIDGNITINSSKITLDENVTINGTLTYDDDSEISGLEIAQILETIVNKAEPKEEKGGFGLEILSFISKLVALLLTAYIINAVFPRIYANLNKELKFKPIINKATTGLGILIILPIVSLFALFTGILTPAAIITLILYGIICYVGKLTIISILGNKIYSCCFKKECNAYFSILIGVTLYELIKLVPFIGSIVGFLVLIIGFGYAKELLFKNNKLK